MAPEDCFEYVNIAEVNKAPFDERTEVNNAPLDEWTEVNKATCEVNITPEYVRPLSSYIYSNCHRPYFSGCPYRATKF
jgi:hypothetical protein